MEVNVSVLSASLAAYFLGIAIITTSADAEYCYAKDINPYFNFSSKTAYEHSYYKQGIAAVPDCKAVQMWLTCRHGTRWPAVKDITKFNGLLEMRDVIVANHAEKRGTLCSEDLDNLKNWSFTGQPNNENLLIEQGKQDLYQLGKRLRGFFSDLIGSNTYSPEKFAFRHTDTARTQQSAEYFARGIFGQEFTAPATKLPAPIKNDRMIHSYEDCPSWELLRNRGKVEQKKFMAGEFYKQMVTDVSTRLGYKTELTTENIKDIYNGCRYQKAWHVNDLSPWCAAFTKENLEVLEYNEDINYYYKSGPGTAMNFRLACPLIKDMIDHFSKVEKKENKQLLGEFYFSHSSMINIIAAGLRLTHDTTPPTADNYLQQKNRHFRTSHIIPFTGNVLAVLYSCTKGDPLQVVFYVGEEKVQYVGCNAGVCPWKTIKNKFASQVQDPKCTDDKDCFDIVPRVCYGTDCSSSSVVHSLAGAALVASSLAVLYHQRN